MVCIEEKICIQVFIKVQVNNVLVNYNCKSKGFKVYLKFFDGGQYLKIFIIVFF